MFGALVKMSGDLVPTPDLSETIEGSADGTVYTFTLREGLAFNDGTPLTSADVIFTLERAINPLTGSIWKGRLSGVLGAADYDGASGEVEGLKAIDERTVEITLAKPDSAFLVNFCSFSGLGILPKHILGEVAPEALKENPFSLAPNVTAGGFSFVQFATDQFLEMQRNTTYPGEVGLDRILHANPHSGSRARPVGNWRDRSHDAPGLRDGARAGTRGRDRRHRAKPEHGLPGGQSGAGVPAESR